MKTDSQILEHLNSFTNNNEAACYSIRTWNTYSIQWDEMEVLCLEDPAQYILKNYCRPSEYINDGFEYKDRDVKEVDLDKVGEYGGEEFEAAWKKDGYHDLPDDYGINLLILRTLHDRLHINARDELVAAIRELITTTDYAGLPYITGDFEEWWSKPIHNIPDRDFRLALTMCDAIKYRLPDDAAKNEDDKAYYDGLLAKFDAFDQIPADYAPDF